MPLVFRLVLPFVFAARITAADYVGSKACQPCHADRFQSQSATAHAHALSIAPPGSPGNWAFGAGAKAITYVSQINEDQYLEHGLSYYESSKSMGPTPGHANGAGLRYRTFDPVASVLRCFRCHSTGPLTLGAGISIEPSEPGLHCESCHGPGAAHVEAGGARGTIHNPGQLNAVQLNEFCGTCHRKPPEAGEETDWSNAWNIRHEPDYLSHSACFRKSGDLSCITCHDPHQPLSRAGSDYGRQCSGCHRTIRHRTSIAGRNCVDCHMPQVSVSPQLRFTNHWIGIYDKGKNLVPERRTAKDLVPLRLVVPGSKQPPAPNDPSTLLELFERAEAGREKALGPKDPKLARSAADLGLFLKNIGNPSRAEAPLRKAVAINRLNSDPALPADQENLASILETTGKHEEAFSLFREAAQGSDPGVAARSLAALALLDPGNSEAYYRRALQAEESASGKDHPRVAVLLNDLALALRQKNDNRSAEPLFRRALIVQEKALGANHPSVASTLNNLGSLLQSTGRLAEAERLERRAIHIFEQKLGPESMELATTCSNLADVLWARGDLAGAAGFYERALSLDESVYGPETPEVADDLANLGALRKERGQNAAAQATLRRALAIYEKTIGPNSERAVRVRESLAKIENGK